MKNVLILHGSGNNSSGNWYPWLSKLLKETGWKAWVPDLPDADYPDIDKWADYIFSNKKWQFNQGSVVVGHSSGATLILGLLERLPENVKVKKAILVAGYVQLGTLPQYFKHKEKMLKKPFDWEKIKKSCQQFVFIHSDNDPYECGASQGQIMQKHLGGKLIIKLGEGHFNLEQGFKYKEFPDLLKYI